MDQSWIENADFAFPHFESSRLTMDALPHLDDNKALQKKQSHLKSEKKRREKIQTSYKYLERVMTPLLGNQKYSRADLLRKTADLVQAMSAELNQHRMNSMSRG